jgi:hypothetical protein
LLGGHDAGEKRQQRALAAAARPEQEHALAASIESLSMSRHGELAEGQRKRSEATSTRAP